MRQVLALPVMKDAELVAGIAGLDRPVRGVNIIEVPDVWRWLRGGELLFTAGHAWRDEPSHFVDAIRDFYRKGVAGLVVKPSPYLPIVPAEARQVADDLGFPLLRIPPTLAYMDVIDVLVERLGNSTPTILTRLADADERLLASGLDEQSVELVVELLAGQVGHPVWVLDLVDERTVSAMPTEAPQVDLWTPIEARFEAIVHTARTLQLNQGHAERKATLVHVSDQSFLCTPLLISGQIHGYLLVGAGKPVLDDYQRIEVSHAAEMVSFLLLKRLALLQGRSEAMALLLDSLFQDRLTTEEATERALALGLRLAHACQVLVLGSRDDLEQDRVGHLRNDISRTLQGIPHAVGTDGRLITVIIQADADAEEGTSAEVAEHLWSVASRHGLHSPVVALGSAHPGHGGLRQSRSEALIAYDSQVRLRTSGTVHFSSLGVERVLSQIPLTTAVTEEYIRSTLGPVENDPELLRTLQVFIECGGHKLATAARVPLHRSSLEYRLDKISKLLGVDIDVPEHHLEIWLAIRLRELSLVAARADW
jgi:purine catabolism regulator